MPRTWKPGYVSCGFAKTPDLLKVLDTAKEIGFEVFEIELWKGHLHPKIHDAAYIKQVAKKLSDTGLQAVLSTGEEFVLSEKSGEPSFVSNSKEDRDRRRDFTIEILDLANELGAPTVQIVSGPKPPGVPDEELRARIVESLDPVLDAADVKNVNIALENDPGHFVRTVDEFKRIKALLPSRRLMINLDLGHVRVAEETPAADIIRSLPKDIENVHLEDTRGRKHYHLPPGEGDTDFAPIFDALAEIRYGKGLNIELYGFARDEIEVAREAYAFLAKNS